MIAFMWHFKSDSSLYSFFLRYKYRSVMAWRLVGRRAKTVLIVRGIVKNFPEDEGV